MEHHLTTYITHDTLISALGSAHRKSGSHPGLSQRYHPADGQTDCGHSPIGSYYLAREIATTGRNSRNKRISPDGTTVHTDYQRTHPSVRTNFGRQTCGLILSTTKGNIDLLARHTEHPDEAVFLWKWQKTLPVISMLRNGYMSSPTPAYQECQPL